jgi:hypothetical protein
MKTKWLTQDFTDKLFHRQGLVDSAAFYLVNWAIFSHGIHPVYRVDSATKNTFPST